MTKNKLLLGRYLFTLFIIISFGLIIMNEKGNLIFKKPIEKKIEEYLKSNYSSLNNINKSDVIIENNQFKEKISSKDNKNHFFYITYYKKEINDTYETDYIEGKNLLNHIKEVLEKEIKEQTNKIVTIEPITTLNNYSDTVQEQLIKEKDLLELKFYTLKGTINCNWTKKEITKEINDYINIMKDHNITPKYYELTINDKKDKTHSVTISHITEELKEEIIEDIINHKETEKLKESKITYKYLNEEE